MRDSQAPPQYSGFEIAIVGMAGRFPGARNLDEFWHNLCHGVESITFFTDAELTSVGIDPDTIRAPQYVKARGIIADAESFDAAFFGYTPREAELMDPQQRVFLECAWEALEHAGYDAATYHGALGVYAGLSMNTYMLHNLYAHSDLIDLIGDYQTIIGNDKDFLTTRVSYKLNLHGPGVVVQTACSTSLVAVHLACQALLSGDCDMALSGGVCIKVPQTSGRWYQEEGIVSPDGHCRAFDARAQGIVSGNGVGIVVLKRLTDALAHGDFIHAVIKGTAINNDGASKVGYTAPSVDGQAEVISRALAMAEVSPDTIGYIEAHGTGTALGDPIEIAGLTQAFRTGTERQGFCALGSVKTNIGHLDVAAGIAGLLKTVLALKHKELPPSLHCEQPNPTIDFASSPFYVNTTLAAWPAHGMPRRAGVSSFGIGGTNAHAILEEAPPQDASGPSRPWQLLVLSAQTRTALETATANLVAHMQQQPHTSLADTAYVLQVGRRGLKHRRMVVCQDRQGAISTLLQHDTKRVLSGEATARSLVFMFPGQGAQYVHMGRDLYQTEPTFRQHIDRCAALLQPHLGVDLRQWLYPGQDHDDAATQQLVQTAMAQPALFAVEYALAQLWMQWGLRPHAMIGHSIGEYVAACLAGVFTLEDGLALVAERGRLMQSLPGGAMLAVPLPARDLEPHLDEALSLAAVNGPSLCVVSGPTEAVQRLHTRLAGQDISSRLLHTSHAFHSAMVDPILAPFTTYVSRVPLNPPQIPFLSSVSGTWITAAEATDARYWAHHCRHTVAFSAGIQTLLKDTDGVLLEVGPGNTLSTFARQHLTEGERRVVVSSLRHPHDDHSDVAFLLRTLGQLWLAGLQVDWPALYGHEQRRRLPLPTYPFERTRYWIEPPQKTHDAGGPQRAPGKKPDIADWFYTPSWKRSSAPVGVLAAQLAEHKNRWLVFTDGHALGTQLSARLEQGGQEVYTVTAAERFAALDSHTYAINPGASEDYTALIAALYEAGKVPHIVVHLWGIGQGEATLLTFERLEKAQDLGFYSLCYLAQALAKQQVTNVSIAVVSNHMQEVTGNELLCPEKATVLGPVKLIPQEYPNLHCRSLDVVYAPPGSGNDPGLIEQILMECLTPSAEAIVAYRGKHRWVPTVEPIRLHRQANGSPQLRQGGVYLITGGLGGIGLALAEYLAQKVQPKLILTGLQAFPLRHEWGQWLAAHTDDDDISRKIRHVQALEGLGAEVLAASADVANVRHMQEIIRQAEARFGQINGVIHCAGMPDHAGVIERRSWQETERVLAPKVRGTLVLDHVLQSSTLDFFILCSSLGSVLYKSKFGEVGYCAANDFLDAFAAYKTTRDGTCTIAINWTDWQEAGMAVRARQARARAHDITDTRAALFDALFLSQRYGLSTAEGKEVFERILANPLPQVMVSPQDLNALVSRHKALTIAELLATVQMADLPRATHARPDLRQAYDAPRNALEQTIADIWQELFGIVQVGIHDDFFELGGHSLLATQLLNRLSQDYSGSKMSLRTVFDHPTVAGLAQAIMPDSLQLDGQEKDVSAPELDTLLTEIEHMSDEEIEPFLQSES